MRTEEIKEILEIIDSNTNKMDAGDIGSLALSIVAIVVSVLALIYEIRFNRSNLQAIYFEQVFGECLKEKIPVVMEQLDFNSNGKLNGNYTKINKVFMEMIRKSGYFKYAKNDFYSELRQKTMDLEDHLLDLAGRVVPIDQQSSEKVKIHKEVENIFILINRNYHKF